jgi:hypothetical protein
MVNEEDEDDDDDLEDDEDDEDDGDDDDDDEEPEEIERDALLASIDLALENALDEYIESTVRTDEASIELELNDDSKWRLTLKKISE